MHHRGLPRAGKFAAALAITALMAAMQAGLGVAGNPAASSAPCANALSQPFLPWNDSNQYFLVPGGSMESDLVAAGWQLTGGASLAAGNEPYNVSGPGASSLNLPTGSSATTPPICVTIHDPQFRVFAQNTGVPGSQLDVSAVFTGNNGQQIVKSLGSISAGSGWSLSDPVKFVRAIQPGPDGTAQISFRFTNAGAGNYSLDDFYVDPLKSQDGDRVCWGGCY